MRNLANFCCPFRLAIQHIFTYLKDNLIDDVPWFLSRSKTLELLETKKNQLFLSPKNFIVECLTYIIICTIVLILIFISFKYSKEEDLIEIEDEEEENDNGEIDSSRNSSVIRTDIRNNEELELLNTHGYPVLIDTDESSRDKFAHCDCGDSLITSAQMQVFPELNVTTSYNHTDHSYFHYPEYSDVIDSHGFSSFYSNDRQQLQKKVFIQRRFRKYHRLKQFEHEWILRRTRSGVIYGKYKI